MGLLAVNGHCAGLQKCRLSLEDDALWEGMGGCTTTSESRASILGSR